MDPSLADVLLIWVPVIFAVIVGVVGVLTLTVIVPPARERLRLERLRLEIERRAGVLERGETAEERSAPEGGRGDHKAADGERQPEREVGGDAHESRA